MQQLTISIKSNLRFLKFYLIQLIDFTIKSFIAISIFYLFLSVFIFNLQIQQNDFTKKDSLIYTYEVIQVDTLKDNLKSYFFEQ